MVGLSFVGASITASQLVSDYNLGSRQAEALHAVRHQDPELLLRGLDWREVDAILVKDFKERRFASELERETYFELLKAFTRQDVYVGLVHSSLRRLRSPSPAAATITCERDLTVASCTVFNQGSKAVQLEFRRSGLLTWSLVAVA